MEYAILFLGFLCVGAIAGTTAGLFGVGGGLVIVPVLVIVFEWLKFSPDILTQLAVGTSLATIIFTSISSVRTHHQKGSVDWTIMVWLGTGILMGAFLGAKTASWLSGQILQILLGGFTWLVALQMGLGLKPSPNAQLPSSKGLVFSGGCIGWTSALFGMGGGAITVPFLTWCNQPVHRAVGTAAAGGFPVAVAGVIGFVIAGWGQMDLPELSIGYVYLPAWFGIVLASVPFARIGAKLAHSWDPVKLKRAFACFLFLVGAKFLIF